MKMTRLLFYIVLCTVSLFAQGHTIDGIRYSIIDDGSVGVDRLISTTQKFPIVITIPSTVEIEGKIYNVTSILDNAFSNISWCYGVVIPNSVIHIGEYAFSKCDDLHHITIGNGLESVGNNAFKDCQRLNKVIISDIESWCNVVFGTIRIYGETIMKSDLQYREQANPLYWAHHLYLNEEEITNLVIPSNITEIKDCTFIGGNFSTVSFHENITKIGDASFCNCSYLKEIILPDKLTSLGESAFSQIEYLTKVSLGASFRGAGLNTFSGDDAISEIYSFNAAPPKIQFAGSYFGGFANNVFQNAKVYVPYGSSKEYREDYVWGRFLNLFEMQNSGVEEISSDNDLSVSVQQGNIIINGNIGDNHVKVISINGQTMYHGCNSIIMVHQKGIYIVSVSGKTFKVVI